MYTNKQAIFNFHRFRNLFRVIRTSVEKDLFLLLSSPNPFKTSKKENKEVKKEFSSMT
jgi:hypothetical protein